MFLSDSRPIIAWLPLSLAVTCCLEDLTDVTLVFEGVNSKLLDVVSAAEECVDDSVVNILKLRFGRDFEFELWT